MNEDRKIKLCMIGAGKHASRNIYPCFRLLKNAQISANADLDIEKAKREAVSCGIAQSYSDYHEMLKIEKPDGLIICIGPDLHAKLSIELLELGYNVYTEKPPASNFKQVKQVLAVQKRTGKICMTGFKKRFAPAYIKTKELLNDKTFGEPALLNILRTSGAYGSGDKYLLDSAIHVIDLASYLCGKIHSVNAVKGAGSSYSVTLTFSDSVVGSLSLTDRMSYQRGWEQVTIITSGGLCVQVDNSVEMLAFHHNKPVLAHKPEFVAGNSHSSVEMGFVGELQTFVNSIIADTIPESSIEQAAHTMAIIDAINKSLKSNKTILVEEL